MTSHNKIKSSPMYLFFKTFSASLGTGLFLDKVVSAQQWAPFRHTQGLPLELQRETDFTYQSKEGKEGRKGLSFGQSGPSESMNTFKRAICISHLQVFMRTVFFIYGNWTVLLRLELEVRRLLWVPKLNNTKTKLLLKEARINPLYEFFLESFHFLGFFTCEVWCVQLHMCVCACLCWGKGWLWSQPPTVPAVCTIAANLVEN